MKLPIRNIEIIPKTINLIKIDALLFSSFRLNLIFLGDFLGVRLRLFQRLFISHLQINELIHFLLHQVILA